VTTRSRPRWAEILARLYEEPLARSGKPTHQPKPRGTTTMSGEITRWLATTPVERQRDRTLERVDAATVIATERIGAVVQVGQTALVGVLAVAITKHQAELVMPDASAELNLVGIRVAQAIGSEVDRFARRL
jgi:hypothetical protein